MRIKNHYQLFIDFALGGLLVYALSSSIMNATLIHYSSLKIFGIGLLCLGLLAVAFYNAKTRIAAGIILLLSVLFIYLTLDHWDEQVAFAKDLAWFVQGYQPYHEDYALPVVSVVCFLFALLTEFFLLLRFNFYALMAAGFSTFAINRLMDYRQNETAFLIFLFCTAIFLIRKMNSPSGISHEKEKQLSGASLIGFATPVCLVVVLLVGLLPVRDDFRLGKALAQWLEKPLSAVNDFFYLQFNPKFFSFQTTGFANRSGSLGGPVVINDRAVMRVDAPNRLYLSGAVNNEYTGRAWYNDLNGGVFFDTYDPISPQLEFLETAAMMINALTFETWDSDSPLMSLYRSGYIDTESDIHYIQRSAFPFILTSETINLSQDSTGNFYAQPGEPPYSYNELVMEKAIISYLPLSTILINIGGNRTGTLFRPPKNQYVLFAENGGLYANQLVLSATGDIRSSLLLDKNTYYGFTFLNVENQFSFVQETLRQSKRGIYRIMRQRALDNGYSVSGGSAEFLALLDLYASDEKTDVSVSVADALSGLLYERLVDYADSVYRNYTSLPDSVPPRVYELAKDITKNCETNYDRVIALEQYLVTYPYTLSPATVPEGYDFVDYFLFEGKEGYCSYYASAMAVLSRCIGLPSRYVEGYLLPPERSENGYYEVTNRQAHAWAEVYLEGYGWLTVEATAPYYYALTDADVATRNSLFTEEFRADPSYPDYLRGFGVDEYEYDFRPIAMDEASTEPDYSMTALKTLLLRFMSQGIALLVLFVALASYLFMQKAREILWHSKVRRMDGNRQVQFYFKGILKMTRYYHYPFQQGETTHLYAARVGRRFAFQSDTVFLPDLAALYYKAKYGGRPLTEEEVTLMKNCYFDMIKFLKTVRSWPRFLYLRYVRRVMLY